MAFDTFDNDSVVTGGVTFSGGNLIAQATAGSLANSRIAQAREGKTSGKWYVEFTCGGVSGNVDGVGVISSIGVAAMGFIGNSDTAGDCGWGYYTNNHVAHNNVTQTSVNNTTWGNGDVIGVAIDLDNKKVWWRKGTGSWVGTSGTPDPATNTSGFDISNMQGQGRVFPAANMSGNGAKFTANFGASAFTGSVPSGFNSGWTNTGGNYFGTFATNGWGQNTSAPPLSDVSVSKCVATISGNLDHVITNYSQPNSDTVKCVIYDDTGTGGLPGALLGVSAALSLGASAGEQTFNTFSPAVSIVSGHTYYIGFISSAAISTPNVECPGTSSAGIWFAAGTYASPPSTFPASPSTVNFKYPMLIFLGVDVTASGSLPTISLSAIAGTANTSSQGSGSLPTITMSAPAGTGNIGVSGEGVVGTVTLTPPEGGAGIGVTASGPLPTLALNAPAGTVTGDALGQGSLGTITFIAPRIETAFLTQFGVNVLTQGSVTTRLTQFGLKALAKPSTLARTTQMGLLVLASGGETPLKPNPLSLQDGGRKQIVYQRMVNMYVEPTPQGPGLSARYPRPGLYAVATRGGGPVRKTFTWQGFRFTVSGGVVFRDDIAIGTVPATGNCRFALSDEEVVIVSGGSAWYVTNPDQNDATVEQITDPDLPPNVIDVVQLAGRFVYMIKNSGQYHYSEVGDARNIDGLSFATAAENTADSIVAGAVIGDNIVFFLGQALEWWYPSSDPDAPFYRSQGRRNDKGLAAQESVVEADNTLFFIGNDRMVYRALSIPLRVSNYQVEDELRKVADADLPSCSCVSLSFGGHSFLVVHLVGRGSWVLDIGQKLWYNWESYQLPLLRVNCADKLGFIGDMYSGDILGMDGQAFYDKTSDPIRKIVSSYVKVNKAYMKNFNLILSCARGVGTATGQGANPVVEMHFSDDEGRTWSDWLSAPLGRMGDGSDNAKAIWTQLGSIRAPGRLFEFRCSDPVFFAPWELRINEDRL